MVSLSGILSGRDYIGLGENSSVSELINILGEPDVIDEYLASGQKCYIYDDLNVITDPDAKSILSFSIYAKGKSGTFTLPDIISNADFIKKESTFDEIDHIFRINNIKFETIDRDGDRYMKLLSGEIVFFQYIKGIYNIYGIYLNRI